MYGATLSDAIPRNIVTAPGKSDYAAEIAVPDAIRTGGPGIVRWRVHVLSGRIAVGAMKPDRSDYLTFRTVDAGPEPVDIYLRVDALADAGFLMIANGVPASGQKSVVDVHDITLLRPPR